MKKFLCLSLLSCYGFIAATTLHLNIHLNGQEYNLEQEFDGTNTSFSHEEDNLLFDVTCNETDSSNIICDVTISEDSNVIANASGFARVGDAAQLIIDATETADIEINLFSCKE